MHKNDTEQSAKLLEQVRQLQELRFLGDEAIRHGWSLQAEHEPTGKRVWSSAPAPPGSPRPTSCTRRTQRHDPRSRDDGRRHDALRHPPLPPAARHPGRRDPAHPRPRRDARTRRQGDEHPRHDERAAASTPPFSPSARISASAPISRPERRRNILDAVTLLHDMEGEEPPLLGRRVVIYGGGNTAMDAARTAKRLGASEAIIVYRRTRERMPAHDFEVEEACEEGVLMKWLSTIKHVEGGKMRREDGSRRDRLSPADRRNRGDRGRLARARARPGRRPLAARRRSRTADRGRRRRRGRA